ncbi:MAG: tetratricopeptide repeat protein [Elusimicrobiota bacterium]
MADISERRKYMRFIVIEGISEPVEVHFPPPFYQEPVVGKIINISASGMGLSVSEPIPKFFIFSLYIRLRGVEPFEVKGKVIRLDRGSGNEYIAGITFAEIDDATFDMLNLIADDYNKCLKKRQSDDTNFCFDECMFATLCSQKDKSATIHIIPDTVSKIEVQDIKQETVREQKEEPELYVTTPVSSVSAPIPTPVAIPPVPSPAVAVEPAKPQIKIPGKKKILSVYYIFLGVVFIVIVGLFSKDKITKFFIATAEKKLLIPEYKSAVKNYKIVLKYEPKNIEVRAKLASTYNKMKMYANTEREYKKIQEIKPDNFDTYLELGKLYIKLNRISDAITNLKKAKFLMPQNQEAKAYLGVCYEKNKKYDDAMFEFANISHDSILPSDVFLSVATVFGLTGKYKDAVIFLNKSGLQKTAVEYFETGIVKNETETDVAILNFLKALAKKNDFAESYEWLGLLYRRKALYDVAIECYREALNIKPDSAQVLFNIAQLHALKDDNSNALAALNSAVLLDKTYIEFARESLEFNELKNLPEFRQILRKR